DVAGRRRGGALVEDALEAALERRQPQVPRDDRARREQERVLAGELPRLVAGGAGEQRVAARREHRRRLLRRRGDDRVDRLAARRRLGTELDDDAGALAGEREQGAGEGARLAGRAPSEVAERDEEGEQRDARRRDQRVGTLAHERRRRAPPR